MDYRDVPPPTADIVVAGGDQHGLVRVPGSCGFTKLQKKDHLVELRIIADETQLCRQKIQMSTDCVEPSGNLRRKRVFREQERVGDARRLANIDDGQRGDLIGAASLC